MDRFCGGAAWPRCLCAAKQQSVCMVGMNNQAEIGGAPLSFELASMNAQVAYLMGNRVDSCHVHRFVFL